MSKGSDMHTPIPAVTDYREGERTGFCRGYSSALNQAMILGEEMLPGEGAKEVASKLAPNLEKIFPDAEKLWPPFAKLKEGIPDYPVPVRAPASRVSPGEEQT